MIRKVVFPVCFFSFVIMAAAQEKVAEFPLDYDDPKFGKNENSAWLNYCRNSNQFILSVIEKDEVSHVLLNGSMAVLDSFSEEREKMGDYVEPPFYFKYLHKKNTLYGKQFRRIASIKADSLAYVTMFAGEKNNAVYFHLLDFSKKISAFITAWLPEEAEHTIGYYQLGGKLCWVTLRVEKKTKELRFYALKKDLTIGHQSIGLVFKQVDLSGYKTDKLLRDIALVDYTEYPDNLEASRKIKIYPTPKGIFLTLNGRTPVTTLIFADGESGLVTERIFDHPTGNITAEKIVNSCSYKFRDHLFLLSTSADEIFTTIINLETGDIEKKSVVTADRIIIETERAGSAKNYEKKLKSIFELLNKGDLFIKAKDTGPDIEVNIGSCAPIKFWDGPGSRTLARIPGTNGIWNYWINVQGPTNFAGSIEPSVTLVFATTRMSTLNFENLDTEGVSEDTQKQGRINYLIIGTRDPKAITICKTGDIFYTGIYTKTSGKYSIHKF